MNYITIIINYMKPCNTPMDDIIHIFLQKKNKQVISSQLEIKL